MKELQAKSREWGDDPVHAVNLTDEQRLQLQARVHAVGRARKRNFDTFNEADFASGAMAVMEALAIGCPPWVCMILAGRPLFDSAEGEVL